MTRPSGEIVVAGVVEEVIPFKASTDHAGVLRVRDKEKKLRTIVGVVDGVKIDDFIVAEGIERAHPVHGLQLRASTVRVSLPSTKEATALWLVRHFHMDALYVKNLLDDWYADFASLGVPPSLGGLPVMVSSDDFQLSRLWSLINANSPSMVQFFEKHDLQSRYPALVHYVQKKVVTDELLDMGLDSKESLALVQALGLDAAKRVNEDAYTVYYYVESMSFQKIDKIYLAQPGARRNDDRRVRALCMYQVRDFIDSGYTAILYDDLIALVEEEHEYLSATKIIQNLHELEPELLTFYGADSFGVCVQSVQLARFEKGFAEWVVTGIHPDAAEPKNGDQDDLPF